MVRIQRRDMANTGKRSPSTSPTQLEAERGYATLRTMSLTQNRRDSKTEDAQSVAREEP